MMNNFDLRLRMRRVIKPNFQVLLVIALIVSLPGLLVSVVTVLTGSDLATYLASSLDTSVTAEQLMETINAHLAERGWITWLATLLQGLITPVLSMGLITAFLSLLRGGTATVSTVFSRLHAFGRSVLLTLIIFVKLFLWALPGAAVMTLAACLLLLTRSFTVYSLLTMASLVLMVALVVMASYRYIMALFFLADEPGTGALACVRKSKAVMKNRKLQLFSLELPYIAGNWLAASFISLLLDGVIGTTLSLVIQLIFAVYIYGARCVFFEAYSRPGGGRAHAFQSDPYHDDEMKDTLN